MRTLLIIIILAVVTATAQVPIRMKTVTVGTLPAAADAKDIIYRVSDGQTVTDCTSGGGSIKVQCQSDGSTWSAVTANLTPSSRQIATTSPISGGGDMSADRTIAIADAAADGSTKGAATFTASDFNSTGGNISLDYTNGQAASGSTKGFLSSGDWTTFNGKVGTSRAINTTSPITGGGDLSADRTIAINNAAADGSTKGAASFTAADFDASSGNISIDYTNGQTSTGSVKGFLTPADWTTFNAKASQQTFVFFATTTAPACSNGGGTTTFLGPSGAGSATETSVVRYVVPLAGTVKNLRVWLGGNVPASESAVIKVVSGGSAQTNPTCTIAAGAAVCSDTSGTLSVSAADTLNVQINCSGGTSALNARASVSFTIQ
jgi:hypothetical protein